MQYRIYLHQLYTSFYHQWPPHGGTCIKKEGDVSTPAEIITVQAFNSCTKYMGSPGIIHNRMPDCHPVSWTWMIPQVLDLKNERSLYLQTMCVIDVLGLLFWHVFHGVCTARHWQTSIRLVQGLNVYTVHRICFFLRFSYWPFLIFDMFLFIAN